MDLDDPRRPLLGTTRPSMARRLAKRLCGVDSWRRRLPIATWARSYSWEFMLRDAIAGITVGLTSIPQGIAYAIVAGVPPQVGLYSSSFPGYVYVILGSCKDVTVGPTAILAALLAKYTVKSVAFAYLAAFLTGFVILLLGILQLGFLLNFISKPVISGFTTAAALQIGASQLKTLFAITGSSGNTFVSAIWNFFAHIKTVKLWDSLLGVVSIVALILLKKVSPTTRENEPSSTCTKVLQYVTRARNTIVVFIASLLAYVLYVKRIKPFALTGKIEGGLPEFGPPPFSTVVGNRSLGFEGMLEELGPEGLVMPLVAILESIAIAKAFAGGKPVDATQEMLAIGACNLVSSFCQSMPSTGSFTRTALNHASGVMTPGGAFFKATLVLLAVTLLSEAFYFIPRATLAGIIVVAMASIVDFNIIATLWRNNKVELLVYFITVVVGATLGLEYGILAGAAADAARLLLLAATPPVTHTAFKVAHRDCVCVPLLGWLAYCATDGLARRVRSARADVVVIDGKLIRGVDLSVAESLIAVILELESENHACLFWNFPPSIQGLFEELHPGIGTRFVTGPSIDQHILSYNF